MISIKLVMDYTEVVKVDSEITSMPNMTLILENQPPTALFNYGSSDPYFPMERSFSALSSYSPDDEIVSYSWQFGDGSIA